MPTERVGLLRGAALSVLLCCANAAHSALITDVVPISTGGMPAPGAAIAFPSLDLFDPTLGELNSVDVTIQGFLTLSLDIVPYVVGIGPPISQTVTATLTQELAGLMGGDFDFTTVPQVLVQQTAAFGSYLSQVTSNYHFRFDATSDMLGFAVVEGGTDVTGSLDAFIIGEPFLASGTRADFIDSFGLGSTLYRSMWSSTYSSPLAYNPLTFTYTGSMQVTYDYTPAGEPGPGPGPGPVPVPEPPTWLLLTASGFALLLRKRSGAANLSG